MIVSIPCLYSAINFLMNGIFICYGCSQILELFHSRKAHVMYLYVVILSPCWRSGCTFKGSKFSHLTARFMCFEVDYCTLILKSLFIPSVDSPLFGDSFLFLSMYCIFLRCSCHFLSVQYVVCPQSLP